MARAFLKTAAFNFSAGTPNPTSASAQTDAQVFDLIMAKEGMYSPFMGTVRSVNPDIILLAYHNGAYAQAGSTPASGAYPTGSYAKTSAGNYIVSNSFGNWQMDLGDATWIAEKLANCTTSVSVGTGYQGVIFDLWDLVTWSDGYNASATATGTHVASSNNHPGIAYSTWKTQLVNLYQQCKGRVGSGHYVGSNTFDNGPSYFTNDANTGATSASLWNITDIGMAEVWLRNARSDAVTTFPPLTKWKQGLDMLVDVRNHPGKSMVCMIKCWTGGTATQLQQWQRFGLATFLLGTDGNSYYGFSEALGALATTKYAPDWNTDIGSPTETNYVQVGNVYRRYYTKALVLVNPTTTSQTYTLPAGTYTDLNGTTRSGGSLTMGANTGTVLRTSVSVDTTPPGSVSNFAAPSGSLAPTSIRLTWTDPVDTDLSGVHLRRATGGISPVTPTSGTALPDVARGVQGATDSGLTPSTTYSYSAFTFDQSGNVNNNVRGVTATTPVVSDSTPPGPVASLTATLFTPPLGFAALSSGQISSGISYLGETQASNVGGSVTVSAPSVNNGDLMLAAVATTADAVISAPSGWDQIADLITGGVSGTLLTCRNSGRFEIKSADDADAWWTNAATGANTVVTPLPAGTDVLLNDGVTSAKLGDSNFTDTDTAPNLQGMTGVIASDQYPGVLWITREQAPSGQSTARKQFRTHLYAVRLDPSGKKLIPWTTGTIPAGNLSCSNYVRRFQVLSSAAELNFANFNFGEVTKSGTTLWIGSLGTTSINQSLLTLTEPDPYSANTSVSVSATYFFNAVGNASGAVILDGAPYVVTDVGKIYSFPTLVNGNQHTLVDTTYTLTPPTGVGAATGEAPWTSSWQTSGQTKINGIYIGPGKKYLVAVTSTNTIVWPTNSALTGASWWQAAAALAPDNKQNSTTGWYIWNDSSHSAVNEGVTFVVFPCHSAVYKRIADAEPSSYTFSFDKTAKYAAAIWACTGANQTTPVTAVTTNTSDSVLGTTVSATPISTPDDTNWLVTFMFDRNRPLATTWTVDSAESKRGEVKRDGGAMALTLTVADTGTEVVAGTYTPTATSSISSVEFVMIAVAVSGA